MTLAWPTESRPSRTKFWRIAGNFSSRIALATAARLLPTLRGNLLLSELELFGELRVTVRFLDGIEIFALEIFDERQFKHRAVVGLADDDGNLRQLQQLRRAPAAFAGDQFKIAAALADDERLDDALFADGIGQFAQRLRGKILARLERARTNPVERHALHALARVRRGCGSRSRWRLNGGRGRGCGGRTGLPPNNAPRPRPKAGFAMPAECRRAGELSMRSMLEFKLQLG